MPPALAGGEVGIRSVKADVSACAYVNISVFKRTATFAHKHCNQRSCMIRVSKKTYTHHPRDHIHHLAVDAAVDVVPRHAAAAMAIATVLAPFGVVERPARQQRSGR